MESRKDRIRKDKHRCCHRYRQNPNQPILVHQQGMDRYYRQHRPHLYQHIHLDLVGIHRYYHHIRHRQCLPIRVNRVERHQGHL